MQKPLPLLAAVAAAIALAACTEGESLSSTPMPPPPSEAAPGPTPVAQPPAEKITVNFACENGVKLHVVFDNVANTATVTTDSRNVVVLPAQQVGSGYWYSNGRHGLRGKGNEAMWEVGRMAPIKCTES
jgi:membrane-bound inhibitor of C-type lysozyme